MAQPSTDAPLSASIGPADQTNKRLRAGLLSPGAAEHAMEAHKGFGKPATDAAGALGSEDDQGIEPLVAAESTHSGSRSDAALDSASVTRDTRLSVGVGVVRDMEPEQEAGGDVGGAMEDGVSPSVDAVLYRGDNWI